MRADDYYGVSVEPYFGSYGGKRLRGRYRGNHELDLRLPTSRCGPSDSWPGKNLQGAFVPHLEGVSSRIKGEWSSTYRFMLLN